MSGADASPGGVYVDTSALVKLFVEEAESTELERELLTRGELVSSEIVQIELGRAIARARTDPQAVVADDFEILRYISGVSVVPLDDDIRARAASIAPMELRTLDAIHLASALSLGDDIDALIAYDHRLQAAAKSAGLTVLAPGQ